MGEFAKRSIRFISIFMALALAAFGLSPASAASAKLGKAELQAAFIKSSKTAMATGMVYTPPAFGGLFSYKMVYAPKNTTMPGNLAVSMTVLGISSAVIYQASQDSALSGNLARVQLTKLNASNSSVYPDEAGLAIGVPNENGETLLEYEVTKPSSNSVHVHMVTSNPSQFDSTEEPTDITSDTTYTITDGLVTRVEESSSDLYMPGDGPQVSEFDFSAKAIKTEFAKAATSWTSTHLDSTTKKLGTKLTAAFMASKKAALKYGVTITDTTTADGGYPQVAIYDPSTKRSVSIAYATKKKLAAVGFSSVPDDIGLSWLNLLGVGIFQNKSIIYNTKTRTYSLTDSRGKKSTVKVDSKSRVIAAKILGGLVPENEKFSYGADKALLKKWSGLTTKAKQLVSWVHAPTSPPARIRRSSLKLAKRSRHHLRTADSANPQASTSQA